MKNKDFKISIKTIWILVIVSSIFTFIGALAKIQHSEFSQLLLFSGLILLLLIWAIVLSDIIENKIYNKTFWLMSMFIIPPIALIVYLIRRKKLIELGRDFTTIS